METAVYNLEGKKVDTVELPVGLFGLRVNRDLIHQALTVQRANRRRAIAHTKDRSEVRGGGRKPWRQKGTGRARHGSIRSPLWRGGGITFGPTNRRTYHKTIPKKMRQAALRQVLSAKVAQSKFFVVEGFPAEAKTKAYGRFFASLPAVSSRLVVVPRGAHETIRAVRNLPKTKAVGVGSLNVADLLRFAAVVVARQSIETLAATYGAKTAHAKTVNNK
ncbi:50S ribosomal protein L4 [Candidatus Parcubacteria bacterium]|nr:50S ribosomal protein L4 [Candidatus Parcubacteria bacterium]